MPQRSSGQASAWHLDRERTDRAYAYSYRPTYQAQHWYPMDGDLRGAHRARSPPNLYSSTDSCGPPPSTRTDDPNLTYRQPSGQRKATDESFSKVLSAPKQRKATDESFSKVLSKVLSSKDSPNTTTRRLSRCSLRTPQTGRQHASRKTTTLRASATSKPGSSRCPSRSGPPDSPY